MCEIFFKNGKNELIYKTNRITDVENSFMVAKERSGSEG